MKIKTNITLYVCEHCKKEYKRAKNCENHEYKCWANPKNQAKCFGCAFLTKQKANIQKDGYTRSSERFFCTKKDTFVSPIQYEPDVIKNAKNETMPFDNCKDFKEIDYSNLPF